MPSELTILGGDRPGGAAAPVEELARFMGVPCAGNDWSPSKNGNEHFPKEQEKTGVVVAHQSSLRRALGSGKTIDDFLAPVRALIVFGWEDSPESNQLLRQLSNGTIRSAALNERSSHRIAVKAEASDLVAPWGGLSFETASGPGGVEFELADKAAVDTVILRDGKPFFVRLSMGGVEVFFLGIDRIADLRAPTGGALSAMVEFERLAPMMMFLRSFFGELCWQAPAQRACFIIDDPLLRLRYGCLDFQQLFERMKDGNFSACVAFIPWNFRRTSTRAAAFFKDRKERFSVAVHGCDHTRGEFQISDLSRLRERTTRALWRMERHQLLSGLPFAPVMVFPQGLFSTAAMEALSESRFLAAINTSPYPVDRSPDELTLRDLLEPAITRFSHFPLFSRRYPRSIAEVAFDLFVGKPLLLVEHHDYFRDGCAAAVDFVQKINAMAPSLQWTDLQTICSKACLTRVDAARQRHIRFYGEHFILNAGAEGLKNAQLFYAVRPDARLSAITVNGRPAAVTVGNGEAKISLSLEPFGQAEIVVDYEGGTPIRKMRRDGPLASAKVALRRAASEFRDNVVDRKPALSRVTQKSLKWMRQAKGKAS